MDRQRPRRQTPPTSTHPAVAFLRTTATSPASPRRSPAGQRTFPDRLGHGHRPRQRALRNPCSRIPVRPTTDPHPPRTRRRNAARLPGLRVSRLPQLRRTDRTNRSAHRAALRLHHRPPPARHQLAGLLAATALGAAEPLPPTHRPPRPAADDRPTAPPPLMPLAQSAPAAELTCFSHRLAARLPTLYISPSLNPTQGIITSPGSPFKQCGHRPLGGPLQAPHETFTTRSPPDLLPQHYV